MTRKQLTRDLCVMQNYEAYYDLHPSKGYSGTATYIRKSLCVPCAAETGISGRHTSHPIGAPVRDLDASVDAALLDALDTEGRSVIVDCGLFVLINVYAPNETGLQRLPYKYVLCSDSEWRSMPPSKNECAICKRSVAKLWVCTKYLYSRWGPQCRCSPARPLRRRLDVGHRICIAPGAAVAPTMACARGTAHRHYARVSSYA